MGRLLWKANRHLTDVLPTALTAVSASRMLSPQSEYELSPKCGLFFFFKAQFYIEQPVRFSPCPPLYPLPLSGWRKRMMGRNKTRAFLLGQLLFPGGPHQPPQQGLSLPISASLTTSPTTGANLEQVNEAVTDSFCLGFPTKRLKCFTTNHHTSPPLAGQGGYMYKLWWVSNEAKNSQVLPPSVISSMLCLTCLLDLSISWQIAVKSEQCKGPGDGTP